MANQATHDVYVSALKNTHAMEMQALQVMQRQVERLEHYPAMTKALKAHIVETETQRKRLEDALTACDSSPSTLKEGVMGFIGNMMAIGHTPADDEVLKNSMANHALENYEIAAYNTLIVVAEEAGQTAFIPSFKESLKEEEQMAKTVKDMLADTTHTFLRLNEQGKTAKV